MKQSPVAELLQRNIMRPAELPPDNFLSTETIEGLKGIRFSLINHDYRANAPSNWNAAYRTFLPDRHYRYVMFVASPEHLKEIMAAFRADSRVLGGGAGSGFKDKIISYVDELDPRAEVIGSINVIRRESNGVWRGYNLDSLGYVRSLEKKFRERGEPLSVRKAVIIGAGGTGAPIALALAGAGMKVVLLNRTIEKALKLQARLNQYLGKDVIDVGGLELISREISDADAVVSTIDDKESSLDAYSSLGEMAPGVTIEENMRSAESVLKRAKPALIISDVRLRGQKTEMLKQAERLGFSTLDGKAMAISVATEGFWLLHGKEFEAKNITKEQVAEVMKRAAGS